MAAPRLRAARGRVHGDLLLDEQPRLGGQYRGRGGRRGGQQPDPPQQSAGDLGIHRRRARRRLGVHRPLVDRAQMGQVGRSHRHRRAAAHAGDLPGARGRVPGEGRQAGRDGHPGRPQADGGGLSRRHRPAAIPVRGLRAVERRRRGDERPAEGRPKDDHPLRPHRLAGHRLDDPRRSPRDARRRTLQGRRVHRRLRRGLGRAGRREHGVQLPGRRTRHPHGDQHRYGVATGHRPRAGGRGARRRRAALDGPLLEGRHAVRDEHPVHAHRLGVRHHRVPDRAGEPGDLLRRHHRRHDLPDRDDVSADLPVHYHVAEEVPRPRAALPCSRREARPVALRRRRGGHHRDHDHHAAVAGAPRQPARAELRHRPDLGRVAGLLRDRDAQHRRLLLPRDAGVLGVGKTQHRQGPRRGGRPTDGGDRGAGARSRAGGRHWGAVCGLSSAQARA